MISALIISKNEESNIGQCILSLTDVVDEIVLLDSGSTDRTVDIATNLGARVIQVEWQGYAATKNKGAEFCRNAYILSVDADEVLSPALAGQIALINRNGPEGAYKLDRHNHYLGKWIKTCGWYPDWKIRLYNRSQGSWTGDYVHEELTLDPSVTVQKLNGALDHYSIRSIADHRVTVQKYAYLAAQKRRAQGKKGNAFSGMLAFTSSFLRIYLVQLGFTDGRRGFLIAWYSAMSKWLRHKYMMKMKD